MSVVAPGEAMLELIRGATSRIVIAAPYIKLPSIRRALSQVSASVTECICVTRWLPEDIAAGACDLEIFDALADMPGGRLLVQAISSCITSMLQLRRGFRRGNILTLSRFDTFSLLSQSVRLEGWVANAKAKFPLCFQWVWGFR